MYKIAPNNIVIKEDNGMQISFVAGCGNADDITYQQWLFDGNSPVLISAETQTVLSPSQQIILADGMDIARVTITGEPNMLVEYTVNGQQLSLTLDESGMDTIELDCDTPNTTLLVQAGTAKAVIYAVEVPS